MVDRLSGKVAVVTGAASGIGRAVAELFAREGARVALVDFDDRLGREAEAEIVRAGGSAGFWRVNVSVEAEVAAAYREIVETFGSIDVLVNCAGVIGVDKPTHLLSEEEFDGVFAVDVKGIFFSTKHALPSMMEARRGSIINFSSIYGLIGNDEYSAYHVAKGAVVMQTKQDAAIYGPHGIRVNAVNPGTVLTPLVEKVARESEGGLEKYAADMTAAMSLKRLGEPDDVAYAVLFLASDESSWITGVALPIDGGYTAR
jgi:NAD(P)-dependent dehydrogenase (short-subunit alcohol dehydrogenase family)